MAIITVIPGQNVFNRNYRGSTVYTRNNTVLVRKKHITKPSPQNKIVFTAKLLKESAVRYENLPSVDKQTFDDYVILNPSFKSGINVMVKINISSNYSIKDTFIPITSIEPESSVPDSPILNIYDFSSINDTFDIEWEPAIEPNSKIRFFLICTENSPASSNIYFPFYLIATATDYSATIYFPNLHFYNFINIKATYVNPDGIESPYGPTEIYAI